MMEWWWGLGFHTMFYLAGLATIPKELSESARVDGANEWRMFWQITFPRLRPILLVLVVLRFGTAFALIDEYIILGGFNRDRPTYTWTVYMWDNAFQIGDWNQGYAAAIGLIGDGRDAGGRPLALLPLPVEGLGLAWRSAPRRSDGDRRSRASRCRGTRGGGAASRRSRSTSC